MPQKSNPDVLELVRARCSIVLAHASGIAGVINGLAGGYSRDLQEAKQPFFEGMRIAGSSLDILRHMVPGVEVSRAALLAGFTPGVFATDRALELVAGGMPFREAYNRVKQSVGDLCEGDPDRAISARLECGAAFDVDYAALLERARVEKGFAKRERRKYHAAISRLLGVRYPALHSAAKR